jgi:DHA1 family bicyclomycin/chloramphenicol resistance-like MFS transporter
MSASVSSPAGEASRHFISDGSRRMGFIEFIALMAWLMALPALTIDIMLPALPNIAAEFSLAVANDRQLMITIYMLGFALGQLFYGPVSDRYGRKPMLYLGLFLYLLATLAVVFAGDYFWVLVARCAQGLAAAAPRILGIAIVRDAAAGRGMSRIMSFIMMVFIVVPIFAPLMGSALMQWWDWRYIFWFMMLSATVALLWTAIRLPETRFLQHAQNPNAGTDTQVVPFGQALKTVFTTPQTVGYSLAIGFVFGCVLAYVGSAQQIFGELYELGDQFVLAFGAVASVMALSSITNIRLVQRLGMRRISHVALLTFTVLAVIYGLCGFPAKPPIAWFYAYLSVSFYALTLCMPNFNALAMEPMGKTAGLGSAVIGFYTTVAGALFGWGFGQAYDGSVRPLVLGFFLMGAGALISVLITERGRFAREPEQTLEQN